MNSYTSKLINKIIDIICNEKAAERTKFNNDDYYLLIGHNNLLLLRSDERIASNNVLTNNEKLLGIKVIPYEKGQFELVKIIGGVRKL